MHPGSRTEIDEELSLGAGIVKLLVCPWHQSGTGIPTAFRIGTSRGHLTSAHSIEYNTVHCEILIQRIFKGGESSMN